MQVKQATTPVPCGVCQENFTTQTVTITVERKNRYEDITFPCCLNADCRSRAYGLQQEKRNMDEENQALIRVLRKETLRPVQTYTYEPSNLAKEKARTLSKKIAKAKTKEDILAILEKMGAK